MPPADEPQPSPEATQALTTWLHKQLTAHGNSAPRMTVRRLNRKEYNNTIRDLFGVDLQPARVFPADDSAHGFDHVGSALTLSPLLLEKYLNAAQFITSRTIFTEKPETQKYRWKGHELSGVKDKHLREVGKMPDDGSGIFYQSGPRPNNVQNTSSYRIGKRMGNVHPVPKVPGFYKIRFQAYYTGTGLTPELLWKIYYNPPHLENFPVGDMDAIMRFSKDGGAFDRIHLTRKPQTYEVGIHAEPGEVFTFNFENAPPNVAIQRVGKEYTGPGLVID